MYLHVRTFVSQYFSPNYDNKNKKFIQVSVINRHDFFHKKQKVKQVLNESQ